MIDTVAIKQNVDFLSLVSGLKRKANTDGGEYAGPCPFCGGRDRFVVQPVQQPGGRWFCRQCSPSWGDVISFIQRRDGSNFPEACKTLDPMGIQDQQPAPRRSPAPPAPAEQKPSLWQKAAWMFEFAAQRALLDDRGKAALDYLRGRGLMDETILKYRLGYHPAGRYGKTYPGECWKRKEKTIKVPAGIVIPGRYDEEIWYLKIRTSNPDRKFPQVRGSKPSLFGADNLKGKRVALVVEGEFDCMLMDQELQGLPVGVCTFGSADGVMKITNYAGDFLLMRRVWVALDRDKKGEERAAQIVEQIPRAQKVDAPLMKAGDKDFTDYYLSGGNLREWYLAISAEKPTETDAEAARVAVLIQSAGIDYDAAPGADYDDFKALIKAVKE